MATALLGVLVVGRRHGVELFAVSRGLGRQTLVLFPRILVELMGTSGLPSRVGAVDQQGESQVWVSLQREVPIKGPAEVMKTVVEVNVPGWLKRSKPPW